MQGYLGWQDGDVKNTYIGIIKIKQIFLLFKAYVLLKYCSYFKSVCKFSLCLVMVWMPIRTCVGLNAGATCPANMLTMPNICYWTFVLNHFKTEHWAVPQYRANPTIWGTRKISQDFPGYLGVSQDFPYFFWYFPCFPGISYAILSLALWGHP